MRNPTKLYELWRQADAFSTRPSELLGLTNSTEAYYLDRACWIYGTQLDSAIEESSKKAKSEHAAKQAQQKTLNRYLNRGQVDQSSGKKKSGFADPALKF